ncbi:hypothetical protein BJX61DRAFT_140241 [Aspergillus egyptiacus]|nr:hypothetical protein BJX61DRAFT_140241 [Aspergillus egyptiacus]
MSARQVPDDADEGQLNEDDDLVHDLGCLGCPPDEHISAAIHSNLEDIPPEALRMLDNPNWDNLSPEASPASTLEVPIDIDDSIDRAIAAAANAADLAGRRRARLPPVRPPRPPVPIHDWDELFFLAESVFTTPTDRERQAAEIADPPDEDNEPDRPASWDVHHDYFLYTCRGSVSVIADHLQAVFDFDPPIEERFVRAKLSGVNAYKQMTFLQKYLPGETHTLQRAEARGVLYEVDISDPYVRDGLQELDVKQPKPGSFDYIEPVLPCWAPSNWSRADDAFAAMYLGEHPRVFLREYGWIFEDRPSIEFVRIRMAQIPHLNLSWQELKAAKDRRDFLAATFPENFPRRALPPPEGGFF